MKITIEHNKVTVSDAASSSTQIFDVASMRRLYQLLFDNFYDRKNDIFDLPSEAIQEGTKWGAK